MPPDDDTQQTVAFERNSRTLQRKCTINTLTAVFTLFDVRKTGNISIDELRFAAVGLGFKSTNLDDQVKKLMNEHGSDGKHGKQLDEQQLTNMLNTPESLAKCTHGKFLALKGDDFNNDFKCRQLRCLQTE